MAKQPITPQQVHGKYAGGPKAATRLERDLYFLEEAGYDLADSMDLLAEFTELDREDYGDAEEYADARDEAWDAIMDAIEDIEDLETEDEETTTVTTKTATAKTPVAKTVAKPVAKANPVKTAVAKATGRKPKVESKECRICKITQPLTNFWVKSSRPDGRATLCIDCCAVWNANDRAKKAAAAKPAPAKKVVAKTPVAKPVAKKVAPVTKPVSPREAAARAKDAKAKITAVAK